MHKLRPPMWSRRLQCQCINVKKMLQGETMSMFVDGAEAPSTNIMDMVSPYAPGFALWDKLRRRNLAAHLACNSDHCLSDLVLACLVDRHMNCLHVFDACFFFYEHMTLISIDNLGFGLKISMG